MAPRRAELRGATGSEPAPAPVAAGQVLVVEAVPADALARRGRRLAAAAVASS